MPAPPPESEPAIVSARGVPVKSARHDCHASSAVLSPTLVERIDRSDELASRVARGALRDRADRGVSQVSFPLPFTPVPFTLQPMVVLIGGAALGARLGATSQILYLMLGVAGLPVFAFAPESAAGRCCACWGRPAAT